MIKLTEEEKKAIKYLKNEIERVNKENDFKKIPRAIVCLPLFIDYAETLVNLIEKLQKENEGQQDIIIEKRQTITFDVQSVREQVCENRGY